MIANRLRQEGYDVFDDWYSPGPDADDFWKQYELQRGNDFIAALDNWAARHIFEFDKYHLDRCDIGVLVTPAGRSCHLELGYIIGRGKPGLILLDEEYNRWDVMYRFASGIYRTVDDLIKGLSHYAKRN